MQILVFYILYPFLWIISILPFSLFYAFSDCVYFLIYRIFKYRKKTVRRNLELALPNLTRLERDIIEKKFFKHLCDMFLEMIKTMNISEKEMNKRFVFKNIEVYKELEEKGKSIAILASHYASYEWMISINKHMKFNGYGIYKKIANPHFDKLVKDIRSKFKAYLITTKETKPTIEFNKVNNILGSFGFASDQTPRLDVNNHWFTFMGIETPIHIGAEVLAKRYNMNMITLSVKKVKRGFYEATFTNPIENVNQIPDFKISEQFIQSVEAEIMQAPEYYLWTHKRWKHKKIN